MESYSCKKYSKEQFEMMASFLQKHQFLANSFSIQASYRVEKITPVAKFTKNYDFLWPKLDFSQKGNCPIINQETAELKKNMKIFEKFGPRSTVNLGDHFESITKLQKIYEDGADFSIDHKKGQGLLVIFWGAWY